MTDIRCDDTNEAIANEVIAHEVIANEVMAGQREIWPMWYEPSGAVRCGAGPCVEADTLSVRLICQCPSCVE